MSQTYSAIRQNFYWLDLIPPKETINEGKKGNGSCDGQSYLYPSTNHTKPQKNFASLLKKKTAEDSKLRKGTAILIAGISTGI